MERDRDICVSAYTHDVDCDNDKVHDSEIHQMTKEALDQSYKNRMNKIPSIETNPRKKGCFTITRVIQKEQDGHDQDSIDDLDETNTEDISSEILDTSKQTDIDPDPSSEDTVQSFANEDLSKDTQQNILLQSINDTVTNDQNPVLDNIPKADNELITDDRTYLDRNSENMQSLSRFKVVKIESSQPFRRGRWTCQDFLSPPMAERTADKADRVNEDVGSGNSSAASSVHFQPGVDDPSKNPLGEYVYDPNVAKGIADGGALVVDFPAALSNVSSTLSQAVPSNKDQMIGEPSKNFDGFENITPGGPVQLVGDVGSHVKASSYAQTIPSSSHSILNSSDNHSDYISEFPRQEYSKQPSKDYAQVAKEGKPSDLPVSGTALTAQTAKDQTSSELTKDSKDLDPVPSSAETALQNDSSEPGFKSNTPGADDAEQTVQSSDENERNQRQSMTFSGALRNVGSQLTPPLLEMVTTAMNPNASRDEESGTGQIAIDNKIEQAMDLVKSHLMYAVREEVESLKEQIQEMREKMTQLENENAILKRDATPETLAKLNPPPPPNPS